MPVIQKLGFVPARSSEVFNTTRSLRCPAKLRPPVPPSSGKKHAMTVIAVIMSTVDGRAINNSCRHKTYRPCFERQKGQTFAAALIVSAQCGQTLVGSFSAMASKLLFPRLQRRRLKSGHRRGIFRHQIPEREINHHAGKRRENGCQHPRDAHPRRRPAEIFRQPAANPGDVFVIA